MAQAFNPVPQRTIQSYSHTGPSLLNHTNSQTLALTTQGRLSPTLSNGLEGRGLDQDSQLFTQDKQGIPTGGEGETTETNSETPVLVAEVVIATSNGELPSELRDSIYEVVQTQPGQTSTRSQLQNDINAIFETGWFSNVRAVPSDTPLGVRVTYEVTPNPVLRSVQAPGTQVLPPEQIDEIFGDQYGTTLNLRRLDGGIRRLNEWYQAEGYILAQVVDAPDVSSNGVVILDIAEGVIEDIRVQFIDETGETVDEDGEPITGRTRDFIVTRELEAQPGDVFNQNQISQDLQRVFNLGIFDDVRLALAPGNDPRKVDVIINLIEGNMKSSALGLGWSSSSGVWLASEFQENNFLGQGQTAVLDAQLGLQSTTFSASLTSAGSTNGNPSVPASMIDAVEAFQSAKNRTSDRAEFSVEISSNINTTSIETSESAQSQPQENIFSIENWQRRLSTLEELLNLSRIEQNKPLEVLTLANLSKVLSVLNGLPDNSDDLSELVAENNEVALSILQDLKSPGLEAYFLLNQSALTRRQSEPQKALKNYIKSLSLLRSNQSQLSLADLMGQDFLAALSDEWQLDQPRAEAADVSPILEAVRIGLLLDTIFTYSVLGDYQAGIYVANSQELKRPAQYLSSSFSNFLSNPEEIRRVLGLNETSLNLQSDSSFVELLGNWFIPDGVQLARRVANTILQSIPESYRLQASRLLFFDFNELSTAANYEAELDALEILVRKQANDLVYQCLLFITSDPIQNEVAQDEFFDTFPEIVPLLQEINSILPSAYYEETQEWNLEGVERIIDISIPALLNFWNKVELESFVEFDFGDGTERISGNQPEDIEIFVESLDIYLEYILEGIILGRVLDEDTPEYQQQQLELAQTALDRWNNQTRTRAFEGLEWINGLFLKNIADSYFKLENFSAASEAYSSAIPMLYEAEEFYRYLQEGSNDVTSSAVLSFLSRFLQTAENTLSPELVDGFIVNYLVDSQFTASLNSADAHLFLEQPDVARQLYVDALNLSEKIGSNQLGSLVYQQTERAEIFYGIALAESMLGNQEDAKAAISEAIQSNELSFPNESLSGGSGVVSLGFEYGYGIPYEGSISANLNFEAENPWLSVSADDKPLAERRCATVTRYFACRQRYFDLYISLLLQQHQENPNAGFDILAFEASEQAKAFSFERPSISDSTQDRFAPAQSLPDIQAAIADDDTLLLQFFLGENDSYLWLLNGDGDLQTHVLPPRAVIEEKAQAFYEMLTSPIGRVRPKATTEIGTELSDMLFAPVADQLGTQRLVIVADGFLQYLPFNVLPNPNPDNSPSESARLGEYGQILNPLLLDHEIIHLPSASALVALRQNAPNRPQADKELAFFANPVFNHRDTRVNEVKAFDWAAPMAPSELSEVEVLYSQIPATEQEIDAVLESDWIPADQVQKFFGYDASLESALDPALGDFRIVHFASHGIFNSKAPERSGVVLSGINEDGVVQAGLLSPTYAFNEMDLSATELVVLSGCRTGLSQGQVGREGVTGLTNGLFDAGAERIVSSLWSVRDDATRELMNRFYRLMLDPDSPMRPAEALTEAQRSMWNEPRWQTPYNWAAFTLQGVWE
ncbi:CHAT domain-containing protein [Leptolyngbya sp. CCY15150]|uniref:CHAT domain-containing protein n=1 Tax=Leptolyngbya sp. CCY15150 TaxID=2767772 RepID=UPI00195031EA